MSTNMIMFCSYVALCTIKSLFSTLYKMYFARIIIHTSTEYFPKWMKSQKSHDSFLLIQNDHFFTHLKLLL